MDWWDLGQEVAKWWMSGNKYMMLAWGDTQELTWLVLKVPLQPDRKSRGGSKTTEMNFVVLAGLCMHTYQFSHSPRVGG